MVKKLIDTNDLKLLEVSGLTINGRSVSDDAVKYLPGFPLVVLHIISKLDNEYEKYLRMIPEQYSAIVFPINNKAYAAFFPVASGAKAYDRVMTCMGRIYPDNPGGSVYAHEFNSLCELEDLVKSRIITKTDTSALYKHNNSYWYLTSEALVRLNEHFIKSRPMALCIFNEHGEQLIGGDAYEKILSYVQSKGK
jgi:hypothetical protein